MRSLKVSETYGIWVLGSSLLFSTAQVAASNTEQPPATSGVVLESQSASSKGIPLILPEGKTLPAGVLRTRIPIKSVYGDRGFDANGKKVDTGLSLNATAGALVIEYGLSDRVSLQLVAPVILKNSVGLSNDRFLDSDAFAENNEKVLAQMAALLAGATPSICPGFEACLKMVEGGLALPIDQNIMLATGETITIPKGIAFKDFAQDTIVKGATQREGQTGLGDIEVGLLYEAVPTGPLTYSVGLGLRFPTGSFADVPMAQRSMGRGTLDAGLRQNLDLAIGRHVMLSWQNQSEQMLVSGRKKKSSLIDPNQLNIQDPTTPAAHAAGSDGKDNTQAFTRVGVRNVGFLKAGMNLGIFTHKLDSLSTFGIWNYNVDGEERLNDRAVSARKQSQSVGAGLSLSGLSYQIPASLDVDYEVPTAGKNSPIAANVLTTTLKAYYKF